MGLNIFAKISYSAFLRDYFQSKTVELVGGQCFVWFSIDW